MVKLHSANEKRRYKVTPSLIGWAQFIFAYRILPQDALYIVRALFWLG